MIGKMFVLFKDNGNYIPPNLIVEPTRKTKGPHIPKKRLANK
jgi:hypothetical protein